jgi:hypothetical protein
MQVTREKNPRRYVTNVANILRTFEFKVNYLYLASTHKFASILRTLASGLEMNSLHLSLFSQIS